MHRIEGKLHGGDLRFGLVVARFNDAITDRLLEGATRCLIRHDVAEDALTTVYVPGAFEIPLAAQALLDAGGFDAVICLGALIRGGTPHFDVLASSVTSAVAQLQLSTRVPIAFGILTCDSIEQAFERAGGKGSNKGWDAALVALEMANLCRALKAAPASAPAGK